MALTVRTCGACMLCTFIIKLDWLQRVVVAVDSNREHFGIHGSLERGVRFGSSEGFGGGGIREKRGYMSQVIFHF